MSFDLDEYEDERYEPPLYWDTGLWSTVVFILGVLTACVWLILAMSWLG